MLHILYGPIGAGKSTFAREIAEKENALRFAGDEWFRTLFMTDMPPDPGFDWVMDRLLRCESLILEMTVQAHERKQNVVLDLGLMKAADRARVKDFLQTRNIPGTFYYINASLETRKARVGIRNKGEANTFVVYVSPEIFEFTNNLFEEPDATEVDASITVKTD